MNQTKPSLLLLSAPGTKHKLILEGHNVLPRRRGKVAAARVGKSKRLSSKGSVGVPTKTLQCEVCEIIVNSETQLSQVRPTRVCMRGQGWAGAWVPHNKHSRDVSLNPPNSRHQSHFIEVKLLSSLVSPAKMNLTVHLYEEMEPDLI